MRPELIGWITVHGLGALVNGVAIWISIGRASREGDQTKAVLRGVIAVCALTIHLVSIFTGTTVIANLSPGQVWGYAILQGALFLTIGISNAYLLRRLG
jgi:hypothetical protein